MVTGEIILDISGDEKSALLSQIEASKPSMLPVTIDRRDDRSVDGRSSLFKSVVPIISQMIPERRKF